MILAKYQNIWFIEIWDHARNWIVFAKRDLRPRPSRGPLKPWSLKPSVALWWFLMWPTPVWSYLQFSAFCPNFDSCFDKCGFFCSIMLFGWNERGLGPKWPVGCHGNPDSSHRGCGKPATAEWWRVDHGLGNPHGGAASGGGLWGASEVGSPAPLHRGQPRGGGAHALHRAKHPGGGRQHMIKHFVSPIINAHCHYLSEINYHGGEVCLVSSTENIRFVNFLMQ